MAGLEARAAFADVVPEARALVARLLDERPLPLAELRRQVADFRGAVAAAAEKDPYLDVRLVNELIDGCVALADQVVAGGDGPDAGERHRLVHVACRYFVLSEDGADDFATMLGFDDDASVFNAAARALGRGDLCVVP